MDGHSEGGVAAGPTPGTGAAAAGAGLARPRGAPLIEVRGLCHSFGEVRAVDGIDFAVAEGEVFGLLGPNGAGKTTTVRMLVTLLAPSGGEAWVAGYDVRRAAGQVRRLLGYVPQLVSADGALTGWENLRLWAKLYGLPGPERDQRIGEVLRFVGLEEAAPRLVRSYSGGMIRKLEIAQALLHRPRVLVLDEPTVGLDPVARRSVWELLHELRSRDGTAILVTTHIMEEAEAACDRLAIMHQGHIVAIGTPAELRAGTGRPDASLEDAFVHYTGASLRAGGGGSYRDTFRVRRTARRLG